VSQNNPIKRTRSDHGVDEGLAAARSREVNTERFGMFHRTKKGVTRATDDYRASTRVAQLVCDQPAEHASATCYKNSTTRNFHDTTLNDLNFQRVPNRIGGGDLSSYPSKGNHA
jgi:hypothetical protein